MPLTAGIIGLPNVGKSTLYNALTKSQALTANYAFTTIEPNVGNVIVPDKRLDKLAELFSPQKVTPASIEITDIAGLVKGAHQGEGLGNQFLSHIRSVDAVLHVVRCFDDDHVTHVDGHMDALRDIENIETELILADLDIIDKRLPKIEKKAILNVDRELTKEFELLKLLKEKLEEGKPLSTVTLNHFEKNLVSPYGFLTLKPMMYVLNIDEASLAEPLRQEEIKKVYTYAEKDKRHVMTICADLEAMMVELDEEEKNLYIETLDLNQSGTDELISSVYALLGLETFFTTENQQLRAWTFKKESTAQVCAGLIHTDFARGFIRAEVINYNELIACENIAEAKKLGKVRSEGKAYLVKDGDIIVFRFNV